MYKNSSMNRNCDCMFTGESKLLNIWFLSLYQAKQQSIIYIRLYAPIERFLWICVYWTMFRRKVHICRRSSHARNTNIEVCLLIDFSTILRSICVNVWNVLATHNYGDTLRSFVFFLLRRLMFFFHSLFDANKSAKESLRQREKKCSMYESTHIKWNQRRKLMPKHRVQANTNSLKSDGKLHDLSLM